MSQNHQNPVPQDTSDGGGLPPVENTLQTQIRPDEVVNNISVSDKKARVCIVSEIFVSPRASTEDATSTSQPSQSSGVHFSDEPEVKERPDNYPRSSIPGKISSQVLYQACAKSPSYLSREEIKEILLKAKEDDGKFMATELGSHSSVSQVSLDNSGSPWSPRNSPDHAVRSSASNSSHESQDSDWLPGDKKNPFRGKVPPVPMYQKDLIDFETEIPNQKSEDNNVRPHAEKKVHPIDDRDWKDGKTDKASRARRDSDKHPEAKQNSFLGKAPPVSISEEDEDLEVPKTGKQDIIDKPVGDLGQDDKSSICLDKRLVPTPSPRPASVERQSQLAGKAMANVRLQDHPTPRQRGRLPSIVVHDTIAGSKQTEFDGKKSRHLHLPGLAKAKQMGKHFKKNLPKLATLPKRMTRSMNKLRGVSAMKMSPRMKAISLDVPQSKLQDTNTGRLSREAFARMRKEKVAAANAEWGQMQGPGTPEKPSHKVQFADRSDLRLYWEMSKTFWQRMKGYSLFKKCSAGEKSETIQADYVVNTGDVC